MKRLFLFISALSFCITTYSQQLKKIESLDSFFAGLPLQQQYHKWVEHIYSSSDLGIDSVGKRGIYSSLKPEKKDHFPFPDSVKVKLLLFTALNIDSSGKLPVDTVRSAFIEGIFGNTKRSKKDADACFNQLYSLLKNYYQKSNGDPSGYAVGFVKGMNSKFPDLILERGYLKEQNFYYVVLMCEYSQWTTYKISIQ